MDGRRVRRPLRPPRKGLRLLLQHRLRPALAARRRAERASRRWLADERLQADAVFVGPRKRHEQTYAGVTRVLATRGLRSPSRRCCPSSTSTTASRSSSGCSPSWRPRIPSLPTSSRRWRGAAAHRRRRARAPSSASRAAGSRGEIGHDEVESWPAFRARVARAWGDRRGRARQDGARLHVGRRGRRGHGGGAGRSRRRARAGSQLVALQRLDDGARLHRGALGLRTFNATPHLRDKRLVTSVYAAAAMPEPIDQPTPVRAGQGFDAAALAAWLRPRVAGWRASRSSCSSVAATRTSRTSCASARGSSSCGARPRA